MKCAQCRARFSAAWAQPAPGGSSAPGLYLATGSALLALSLAMHTLDVAWLGWALLAAAVLVLARTPIAWLDCRRPSGGTPHGGGTCPHCGTENVVRPWSL